MPGTKSKLTNKRLPKAGLKRTVKGGGVLKYLGKGKFWGKSKQNNNNNFFKDPKTPTVKQSRKAGKAIFSNSALANEGPTGMVLGPAAEEWFKQIQSQSSTPINLRVVHSPKTKIPHAEERFKTRANPTENKRNIEKTQDFLQKTRQLLKEQSKPDTFEQNIANIEAEKQRLDAERFKIKQQLNTFSSNSEIAKTDPSLERLKAMLAESEKLNMNYLVNYDISENPADYNTPEFRQFAENVKSISNLIEIPNQEISPIKRERIPNPIGWGYTGIKDELPEGHIDPKSFAKNIRGQIIDKLNKKRRAAYLKAINTPEYRTLQQQFNNMAQKERNLYEQKQELYKTKEQKQAEFKQLDNDIINFLLRNKQINSTSLGRTSKKRREAIENFKRAAMENTYNPNYTTVQHSILSSSLNPSVVKSE